MTQIFSKAPPTPVTPTPTPPPTMPDPMSPSALEAARRARTQTDAGRTSTILTTAGSRASGTLAGGYSGTKTGS